MPSAEKSPESESEAPILIGSCDAAAGAWVGSGAAAVGGAAGAVVGWVTGPCVGLTAAGPPQPASSSPKTANINHKGRIVQFMEPPHLSSFVDRNTTPELLMVPSQSAAATPFLSA